MAFTASDNHNNQKKNPYYVCILKRRRRRTEENVKLSHQINPTAVKQTPIGGVWINLSTASQKIDKQKVKRKGFSNKIKIWNE